MVTRRSHILKPAAFSFPPGIKGCDTSERCDNSTLRYVRTLWRRFHRGVFTTMSIILDGAFLRYYLMRFISFLLSFNFHAEPLRKNFFLRTQSREILSLSWARNCFGRSTNNRMHNIQFFQIIEAVKQD